jgi:hypothetical protein
MFRLDVVHFDETKIKQLLGPDFAIINQERRAHHPQRKRSRVPLDERDSNPLTAPVTSTE